MSGGDLIDVAVGIPSDDCIQEADRRSVGLVYAAALVSSQAKIPSFLRFSLVGHRLSTTPKI
jgi:hypothetical protein